MGNGIALIGKVPPRSRIWDQSIPPSLASLDVLSPTNAVTNWASTTARGVIGHTVGMPDTTPFLHHHRKHSQASRTFSPRAFLSGVKVLLAALKTRSHCVAISGQDKWSRAYRWSVS